MSRFIENAEYFLPAGNSKMTDVYSQVLLNHNLTQNDLVNFSVLTEEKRVTLATHFLNAGLAYLAQRSDSPTLNDVGFCAWRLIHDRIVTSAVTSDMMLAADKLEFQLKTSEKRPKDNHHKPLILTHRIKDGKRVMNRTILFIPPSFVPYALRDPIDSLGTIASLASNLRDLFILPELEKEFRASFTSKNALSLRALSCVAEVLLEAKKEDKNFSHTPNQEMLLASYPEGIKSLPKGIWYWTPPFFPYDTDPRLN
jgi:hypothetical protein